MATVSTVCAGAPSVWLALLADHKGGHHESITHTNEHLLYS